jgi:hypothetical protein
MPFLKFCGKRIHKAIKYQERQRVLEFSLTPSDEDGTSNFWNINSAEQPISQEINKCGEK